GVFVARLPISQEVTAVLIAARQAHVFQPALLSRADDQRINPLPSALTLETKEMATFLPQHIVPAPVLQQRLQGGELAISSHHHWYMGWHQPMDIGQQRLLFPARTVSFLTSHPCPYHRQGAP